MEKGLHHQADSVLQVQVRVQCVYVRLIVITAIFKCPADVLQHGSLGVITVTA